MRTPISNLCCALALGLLSVAPALAQATIEDCEKIQAADAYNQCLAKFGPTSNLKNLEPGKPSDYKTDSADAAATAGKPMAPIAAHRGHRRGGHYAHRSRGGGAARAARAARKRMVINVGSHRHR